MEECLQNLKVKQFLTQNYIPMCLVAQSCPTLCDPMDDSPPGSSVHEESLTKNTRVCCHALLLQGIFPTQGLNPGFPHCRQILSCLSHQGSPRILQQVVYPFSRGSSCPRNQTRVSCISGGFFTNESPGKPCLGLRISCGGNSFSSFLKKDAWKENFF